MPISTFFLFAVPGLFGSRLKTCDWRNEEDQSINESRCDQPENWQNDWLDGMVGEPIRYIEEKIEGTWWNLGSVLLLIHFRYYVDFQHDDYFF